MANWKIDYKTKCGQAHKTITAKTEADAKNFVKKDEMFESIISCKEIINKNQAKK